MVRAMMNPTRKSFLPPSPKRTKPDFSVSKPESRSFATSFGAPAPSRRMSRRERESSRSHGSKFRNYRPELASLSRSISWFVQKLTPALVLDVVQLFDSCFVAQSNGNYVAFFSTKYVLRLDKYESHGIFGCLINCSFSSD